MNNQFYKLKSSKIRIMFFLFKKKNEFSSKTASNIINLIFFCVILYRIYKISHEQKQVFTHNEFFIPLIFKLKSNNSMHDDVVTYLLCKKVKDM